MHLARIIEQFKHDKWMAVVVCAFIGLLLVALITALLINHYTSYNDFDIVIYICAGVPCVAFLLFLLFKGSEAPFFVKQMMGGVFPCECAVTAVLHFLTYVLQTIPLSLWKLLEDTQRQSSTGKLSVMCC